MDLLITLLVFAVIVWLAFWIIGQAFPAPIQTVAKIVVGILALLALLSYVHGGLALPRFR